MSIGVACLNCQIENGPIGESRACNKRVVLQYHAVTEWFWQLWIRVAIQSNQAVYRWHGRNGGVLFRITLFWSDVNKDFSPNPKIPKYQNLLHTGKKCGFLNEQNEAKAPHYAEHMHDP